MTATRHRGFTLIELMIGIAIAVLLVALGVPYFGVWLADSQIRNGAETIAGGMRFAQSQAIKLNQPVCLLLDPTSKTGSWDVRLVDAAGNCPVPNRIQQGFFAEGAEKANFAVLPAGATMVTYTGLGRIRRNAVTNVPENSNGSAPITEVDVTMPVAGSRQLNVLVDPARTGIKICDPAWPATDPKGCPV